MVYQVEASASVNDILIHYSDSFYNDNSPAYGLQLLDAFNETIVALTNNPDRGFQLEPKTLFLCRYTFFYNFL
jgi:hypothetical protein